MKNVFVLLISFALCSCMGTMTVYRNGMVTDKNGNQSVRAQKAFAFSGDITGRMRLVATGSTVELETFDVPADAPMATRIVMDKKGFVVGTETYPLVAGYSNSKATTSLYDGISRVTRSVGSVAGTVLSGLMGIFAVTGATQAAIVESQEATKQVGINAAASKAPLPAAGSTINATTAATVVPIP